MTATTTLPDVLTGDYTIDPAHSRIGFVARHAMVTKVRGSFDDIAGSLHLDAEDPSKSSADITIQVASVNTRQAQRDEHLRTNAFFDVPTFPQASFKSTKVEQIDDENFRVTGDLTIKDVTHPVSVDFTLTGSARDPWGQLRVGFEGALAIRRSDWGLTWNTALDTGGVLVSDKIQIEFDVSAIRTS
jgi:polyisoprenoid-binding protein YceI